MIVVVSRLSVPSTVSNPPVLVKTSLVMVVAPAANTSMVPRLVMAPLVIESTALSVSVWCPRPESCGVGEGVGGGGDVIERERLAGVDGERGGLSAAEPSILLSPVTSMRSLPPLPVMVPPMIVVVSRLSVPRR